MFRTEKKDEQHEDTLHWEILSMVGHSPSKVIRNKSYV